MSDTHRASRSIFILSLTLDGGITLSAVFPFIMIRLTTCVSLGRALRTEKSE